MVCVKGFWQKTCLRFFIAAADTAACRWSVVHTITASRSFCFSSNSRKSLYAVVRVYDFLTRFAACNAARDAKRMGQLNGLVGTEPIPAAIDTEQLADGIAELVCVPLWVIRTDFIGVADSHTLYVGFPQKAKHDAQALGADADESSIDPVAGRNISYATQHPTRNDRKTNCRCGSLP